MLFNLPFDSPSLALVPSATNKQTLVVGGPSSTLTPAHLTRYIMVAAEVLDVPPHYFLTQLSHRSIAPLFALGGADSAAVTLRERVALTVGSALGVVYGPDLHRNFDLGIDATSSYLQRLSLAFSFAVDHGTHAMLASPTNPNHDVSVETVLRDAGFGVAVARASTSHGAAHCSGRP